MPVILHGLTDFSTLVWYGWWDAGQSDSASTAVASSANSSRTANTKPTNEVAGTIGFNITVPSSVAYMRGDGSVAVGLLAFGAR